MNNQGGRPRSGPGGATGVLHVVGGNDRGKQYLLVNPTTQIGRGADQDFVLADIAVSRRHVQVIIEGTRYRLRDLGSGNGTLINGVRTATALLNDGDQIEIGNTLLRFDHPPSSARATGTGTAQAPAAAVPQAPAQARTMIAEAPPLPAPIYAPPAPAAPPSPTMMPPQQTYDQQAYAQPGGTNMNMSASQMMPPMARGGGGLDVKKLLLFGGIGLVVVFAGGVGAMKLLGGGNKEKADKVYADATRNFSAGDYEAAKKLFQQAMQLDPTSKLYPKQFKQCDVEIHAKAALKTAQGLAGDKRWDEEFKVLDSIDKSAVAYEDAEKLRKQAIPAAVAQYLGEAKELMPSDTEGARTKIEAAIALDPDSAEAKDLADKLRGAAAIAAGAGDKPGRSARRRDDAARARPTPTPTPESAPTPAARPSKPATAPAGDEEDEAGAGAFDLLSSKGGAPYKAKDFSGAATQVRNQAKTMKGAAQQKALAAAAQVQKLGELYAAAEADKARNAVAAVNAYQQAAAIDGSVGKGTHGAYFKAQEGKLAKDAAKLAYGKQDFPTAFEMSKIAARLGDDGGVGAQLKQKAKELNTSAAGLVKSNPNGAKSLWRTVVRMVPPGDPAYVAAQKGLSTAVTPTKDEDED